MSREAFLRSKGTAAILAALVGAAIVAATITVTSVTIGGAGGPSFTSGAGAPTATAARGSIYLRTDVAQVYQNSDGATTWAQVGAGSVSGTTNKVAKFTGASAVGDSSISDDGTTITTPAAFGNQAFPVNISGPVRWTQNVPSSQLNGENFLITLTAGTPHDTVNGDVFAQVIRNHTTFDTTTGVNASGGIYAQVDSTRTVGANALTNTAFECSATGGDSNYCYHGLNGTFLHDGIGTFTGLLTLSGGLLTSGTSAVDVSSSSTVSLGSGVQNFKLPGSTSDNAKIGLGVDPASANFQIQTKNTRTTASDSGVSVKVDTTVAASAYGGLFVGRGAGGSGSTDAGFIAGVTWASTSANDLAIYSKSSGTGINFFAGDITDRDLGITSSGHLVSAGTDPTLSSCGTTPTIIGDDKAGTVTIGTGGATACTITFASAFATNAPACVLGSRINSAVPLYMSAASTTAITVTTSTGADISSGVFSYHCIGI